MALTDRLGKSKTIAEIKSSLLNPALTSHFDVEIPFPSALRSLLGVEQRSFNLSCSEASLPGSQLTTVENNNDRTGVTETHAYRRQFDGKMDLTFYVDAEQYTSIRFFERWISFIMNEDGGGIQGGGPIAEQRPNIAARQYHYRARYPNEYIMDQGFKVTKFERNYQNSLTYSFVRAFPVSVSSMPLSYDASALLKVTVSMSYIRYYLGRGITPTVPSQPPPTVAEQANLNNTQFTFDPNFNLDYDIPELLSPGAVDFTSIGAGNIQQIPVDFTRTDLPSFI